VVPQDLSIRYWDKKKHAATPGPDGLVILALRKFLHSLLYQFERFFRADITLWFELTIAQLGRSNR
jgi:hypothetical protein